MISRIAVPSLNAMMSSCVGSCSALPISKTAGMIIARIASDMIDALTPAICALNFWVPFFNPPSSNDAPSTSRTLPMIEPAMLAFTTVTSPSRSATIVMISSAALPSVAFSRPPIFGPVYTATSSVARPSTAASGTSASAESTNIDVCPPIPITSMPSTTGTRTNSAYRNFIIYLPALSLDLLEGPIAPESRIRHADDIRKLCMPVPLQPARYAINELHQHAGPRECRRPNLDRARPRHEELDRIGHSRDSAHADHGNINRPRDLIHHPQRHRPHRRTRKPARDVRQQPVLANITGGLSGPAVRPVALRMVYQVAGAVDIPVIGMGGIATVPDAIQFFMAGASAIQVGTAAFARPRVLMELVDGIPGWLERHGHAQLSDIVGVANPRFRGDWTFEEVQ